MLLFQAALQIGGKSDLIRFLDVLLVSKIIVLILAVIHIILGVRVWLQVRRLQEWMPLLRGYKFSLWAAIHLGLAIVGVFLVLLVL